MMVLFLAHGHEMISDGIRAAPGRVFRLYFNSSLDGPTGDIASFMRNATSDCVAATIGIGEAPQAIHATRTRL